MSVHHWLTAVVLSGLLAASTSTTWLTTIDPGSTDDEELFDLADRFFQWRLKQSPEYGTLFGMHEYDDSVEEYTEAAFEQQVANASNFLAEVRTFNRKQLTKKDKLVVDTLAYNLQTFIDGYKFRRFGMYNPITPLERPTGEWAALVEYMKYENEADYRKLLTRLSRLPVQIDQYIAMMRKSIQNNITVHAVSLTGAIESIDEMIVTNVTLTRSPLYSTPFRRIPEDFSPSITLRYQRAVEELVLGDINEAWIRLRMFLTDEYSLHTRPDISVSSLPGGREYYEACLRWHTSTNITANEIFQTGLSEVDRIRTEMEKIMRAEGFHGTVREFIAYQRRDSTNFFNTSQQLLNGYQKIINRVHDKLSLVLKKNPQIPVHVVRTNNPQGPSGSYHDPSIDLSRPGEFIANVFYPKSTYKGSMTALTLHEAEPGHHTQAIYSLMANTPLFRKVLEFRKYHAVPFNWPFFTAYVEGWALYAESLGEEMNVYTDRNSLFGRYSSEMLRACRLVVDSGMHAFGWSRKQSVEFFKNYTTESSVMIDIEINRYISWPGQACAYKIGELTIQRLKRTAQQVLGTRFDVRTFNDQVLDLGPVPLSVLEANINAWIDDVMTSDALSIRVMRPWSFAVAVLCMAVQTLT